MSPDTLSDDVEPVTSAEDHHHHLDICLLHSPSVPYTHEDLSLFIASHFQRAHCGLVNLQHPRALAAQDEIRLSDIHVYIVRPTYGDYHGSLHSDWPDVTEVKPGPTYV